MVISNRFHVFAMIVSIMIMLISCSSVNEKESGKIKELSMENPASAKCIRDGGELLIIPSKEGKYGVCLFSDGSVCEEWKYFRGRCSRGDCMKKCKKSGAAGEGWYDCSGVRIKQEKCSGK
jgi:putative hemolysin